MWYSPPCQTLVARREGFSVPWLAIAPLVALMSGHPDPVNPDLRDQVLRRDHHQCVAPVLDLSQLGTCSPRLEIDHVKSQLRIGKRAPSRLENLVTLCSFHHRESRAGHIWATTKEHREWLRMYLEWVTEWR